MNFTRDQIEITKIKVLAEEITISYGLNIGDYFDSLTRQRTMNPTIKLNECIRPFTEHLAYILHQVEIGKEISKTQMNWINENLIATGIILNESSNGVMSLQITGKFRTPANKWIGFSSEKIPYDDNLYGFDDLKTEINLLTAECFNLFFQNDAIQKEITDKSNDEPAKKEKQKIELKKKNTLSPAKKEKLAKIKEDVKENIGGKILDPENEPVKEDNIF